MNPIAIAIRLALGRALNALKQLWALCLRYPWQVALAASLLACAWLWHGMTDARAERDAAIAAKVAQAARFSDAMAEADRLNQQARAATEKLSKDIAHAADQTARDLDAISRRALAERVRQGKGLCASATPAASVSSGAQEPAGTDTGGHVAFTADEADALRRHEVRSTVCEGWALDLIGVGLAIPGD
jgi:hypothetical protein